MKRKICALILFVLCVFVSLFEAKSQVFLDWDNPNRHDSLMVLDLYELKNDNLETIFDLTMNMSEFFEFAKDTTLNVFYQVFIRNNENGKVMINVFSHQTSRFCFTELSASGKMPNGILIYKKNKFLINYRQKDEIAKGLIKSCFINKTEKYVFHEKKTLFKYWHNDIEAEGFNLSFEYDALINYIKLIKIEIRNVQ